MTEERLREIELWPEEAGNYGSGEGDEFIPELLAEVRTLRSLLQEQVDRFKESRSDTVLSSWQGGWLDRVKAVLEGK
jgi:hypothetical protein